MGGSSASLAGRSYPSHYSLDVTTPVVAGGGAADDNGSLLAGLERAIDGMPGAP